MLTIKRDQQGSSLIEVLIALLVISVGVMGLVATQLNALTSNRESFYRTQATMLAYDVMDRARANPAQAKSGGYSVELNAEETAADDGSDENDEAGNPIEQVDCHTASCTPEQIAREDINQWKNALASQLPGGDGAITLLSTESVVYTVSVHWSRDGENFQLDFRMRL